MASQFENVEDKDADSGRLGLAFSQQAVSLG
jgi:hypothetical protein